MIESFTFENDRFMLALLDFFLFNQSLFFCSDALQKGLDRLIRWILWYQLSLYCPLNYRTL